MSDADKQAIEDAVKALEEVKDQENLAEIQQKTAALQQALMKLGEAMYAAQQAKAESNDGSDAEPKDDNVVDAEFTEVNDDDSEDKKSA